MALPKISVILPVRNEVRSLGRLLDQLLQQTYPADRFEILIADGRSNDGTRELVERKASTAAVAIRVVDNPGIRSGAGRNAGVAAATGEIILFIDGHCEIPSPHLLQDTVNLLEETGADCLCRPQPLIAFSPQGVGRIIADVRASALGHGRDSLIYNMSHSGFVHPASSGATYRRPVFERLGMYDESFDACEDVEFNTRVAAAGYKAYTDPRLSVYYEPRNSFRGLFRQMMRYGIGRVRLARKHPESASLSQWAPAVLVAAAGVRDCQFCGCHRVGELDGGDAGVSRSYVFADYRGGVDGPGTATWMETCRTWTHRVLRNLSGTWHRHVDGVAAASSQAEDGNEFLFLKRAKNFGVMKCPCK